MVGKVKKYVDEYENPDGVIIVMKEFTDFQWDRMLVYKYPTTATEIFNALGIKYGKSLDLVSGVIFVKDDNIINDIIFKQNFETPPPFFIYPFSDINKKPYYRVFDRDHAIFKCIKKEYLHGQKNYYYYVLKPTTNLD